MALRCLSCGRELPITDASPVCINTQECEERVVEREREIEQNLAWENRGKGGQSMTVKELKALLDSFPEDAEVRLDQTGRYFIPTGEYREAEGDRGKRLAIIGIKKEWD